MSAPNQRPWAEVHRIPSFLERLEEEGGVRVLEFVDELVGEGSLPIDPEGVVYHDRGIRVPGYDATFVHEPTGSRGRPAFSLEVDSIGPRNTWAVFDATVSWDFYLLMTQGVAALAWVSDEEYRIEEADEFETKHDALTAGRFSFGVFLYGPEDWTERADQLRQTTSPAYLRREDGSTVVPSTQNEFYRYVDATPTEFRTSGNADSYLGLLELELTID
ncbi:hypothetical protein [Halopiger aswanensis]|uniref:Uncharacterized protein n=1 Tax=Halopiger aswanensis TaxID=148449 RepID=A0A419WRA1_9EURY|nr:hypothetical protein [Halopiger aswanensis]RKD97974.1 hypothetical protein ATJ93_0972 [Halopiger aswanensis]